MKFLIDLDGTLLNNDLPNLDAVNFISELQLGDVEFMIMTNSISSPHSINTRLSKVGIDVSIQSILNPIVSINSYIQSQGFKNAFIVGSLLEIEQLIVEHEENNPDIVILLDFEKSDISYSQLQKIYQYIQNNIPVISASGSLFYLKNGIKRMDTGSFVAMFEASTKIKIPVFGKPSELYFREGLRLLDNPACETIVVGDDWSTDIVGAKQVGCNTVLVKSGKYECHDEEKTQVDLSVNRLLDILDHQDFSLTI